MSRSENPRVKGGGAAVESMIDFSICCGDATVTFSIVSSTMGGYRLAKLLED